MTVGTDVIVTQALQVTSERHSAVSTSFLGAVRLAGDTLKRALNQDLRVGSGVHRADRMKDFSQRAHLPLMAAQQCLPGERRTNIF